jgi:hypothetical protein
MMPSIAAVVCFEHRTINRSAGSPHHTSARQLQEDIFGTGAAVAIENGSEPTAAVAGEWIEVRGRIAQQQVLSNMAV